MRQLNLLLFFALCLGLALFSIENTQMVTVNLIPGQQFDAPLSIELLVAAGIGALLAWVFTVLEKFQRQVESWTTRRKLKKQSKKIEQLEQTIADLQEEAEDEAFDLESDSKVNSKEQSEDASAETTEQIEEDEVTSKD